MMLASTFFYDTMCQSTFVKNVLEKVQFLDLPNWWLVGGVLRDVYWMRINNLPFNPNLISDIDIKFYNPVSNHKHILPQLNGVKWSIKNQAFQVAHDTEGPYHSVEESIFRAPETINTIGVKLSKSGNLIINSGYGFDDLNKMTFRPTHAYLEKHTNFDYLIRVKQKKWLEKWTNAKTIIHDIPFKKIA